MTRCVALIAAILLACASCGGAQESSDTVEETPIYAETAAEPAAAPPADAPAPKGSSEQGAPRRTLPEGSIARQDLNQIIAAGPAAVLARVTTAPHRQNGRFLGFELTAFHPAPPAAIDLQIGDVVVAVNGLKIVKPDDYFRVFQELKVASELRFEILRKGEKQVKVYPVIEE